MTSIWKYFSAILILAILAPPVSAAATSNQFSTDAWIVRYVLSSSTAEPGSSLSLRVEIEAKKTSYDFELWVVPSSPLTLQRQGSDDAHVKYSQFSAGERHIELFTILVPTSVKHSEIYAINIKAQSFASPAALGVIRLPGVAPDYSYDSANDPVRMLSVTIVTLPRLALSAPSSRISVKRGNEFTVKATVSNTGSSIAEVAKLIVDAPHGIELVEVSGFTNGTDIKPSQTLSITLILRATKEGDFPVRLTISCRNGEPASQAVSVKVEAPPSEPTTNRPVEWVWLIVPLAFVIPLVVLVLLFFSSRRRRSRYY